MESDLHSKLPFAIGGDVVSNLKEQNPGLTTTELTRSLQIDKSVAFRHFKKKFKWVPKIW